MSEAALVVPTLNAGAAWQDWINRARTQGIGPERVLVIDSSSKDDTAAQAGRAGFRVRIIPRSEFNHGGTRMLALDELPDRSLIVYATQDALLTKNCLDRLLSAFDDPKVGAAYGRQLPHVDAGPIGAHARLFNYPAESRVVSAQDIPALGLKSAFISNSFAAYRRSALLDVGGFPTQTIMNEDSYAAARMLLAGWKIAYRADAQVHHSHDYSVKQDFKRYFDIGVFHSQQPWMRKELGSAEGEGAKFVKSELRYLCSHAPQLVPSAVTRTVTKYIGYRIGLLQRFIPVQIKRRLSMHRGYWR